MMKRILVLNTGSSSLKYALFNSLKPNTLTLQSNGVISNIGETKQHVKHIDLTTSNESVQKQNTESITSQHEALSHALDLIDIKNNGEISAVGHRVVHGGEKLTKAVVIDNDVIKQIEQSIPLAPLHNPHNLHGIKTAISLMLPTVKQIAVFDTGFHSTIPKHAYIYGIPYNLYKDHSIRKYGFHGINHEYILHKTSEYLNKPVNSLSIISCHLGAGCSICCIHNGYSIDTSMGMTPLEGLIMATRCGDIDANIIFYLAEKLQISINQCKDLLQNKSGWYGLSGYKDAISLNEAFDSNDELAILAVKAMVHRIQKYIGSYYWQLKGNVHAIVFTAGLGENWSELREMCLENAEQFGFSIDINKNKELAISSSVSDISSSESTKKILVIPANEELNIATKISDMFL